MKFLTIFTNQLDYFIAKVISFLFLSGWGTTQKFMFFKRTELRAVELPIVNQSTCKTNYERAELDISRRMMCAGFEAGGKDSCQVSHFQSIATLVNTKMHFVCREIPAVLLLARWIPLRIKRPQAMQRK